MKKKNKHQMEETQQREDQLRGSLAIYGKGKPILTRSRLEDLRRGFYTERYRRMNKMFTSARTKKLNISM